MANRAQVIHDNFLRRVAAADLPDASTVSLQQAELTAAQLLELFQSQLLSRHLDLESRRLQARGQGFYTIGSSGHEGNAAIAKAFRHDDIAFLHYRDAAFLIQRSKQLPDQTPMMDLLHSYCASAEDPISGGRHKVLGSKSLFIPPQTSTIASHLPKAMGAAFSIPLAKRINHPGPLPNDSVVLCSFGDASANHSTAQGAINCAAWIGYQQLPLPLVFICEDNGIGISTATPEGWIKANFSQRPGLHYLSCDGLNLLSCYRTAKQAERLARQQRQPVFLHIRMVRLLGHAGSDAEIAYLSQQQIEATEAHDPLLYSARLLLDNQVLSSTQICALYEKIAKEVSDAAQLCDRFPRLQNSQQVMASLIPPLAKFVRQLATLKPVSETQRQNLFQDQQKTMDQPQHMARLLNWTLTDLMQQHDNIVLAGEDIGAKGGVYNVTGRLSSMFGQHRVINTLLDEQSILGLAIGLAHNGLLPIPEIQFLAYIHNAEDQIRGEAATLSFFSNGQYTNPMVIRIAGLGYQKGFGGHFHNDNSIAVFRDIPGLILACPSNGADAVEMLREAVRLAREEQRIVVFLEPIALYMARDLLQPEDGLWTFPYRPPTDAKPIRLGEIGQFDSGTDLAIISYGNGYYHARRAAQRLQLRGIQLRVIDLRWLSPLNETAIFAAASPCTHTLIVDECRRSGSLSEALVTLLQEQGYNGKLQRLTAEDSFIALGPAATATLPTVESIVEAALGLLSC
ncbi:MAG: thiamine pyrophosphate-dependent enzyme [Motiliproteus sp.]